MVGADVCLSVAGVAGRGPEDGQQVGTAWRGWESSGLWAALPLPGLGTRNASAS